jgi:flagellar hook assembly protein FlgD
MNTLQFTLVDTGSDWTETEVKTQLKHNGRDITNIVRPGMINHKKTQDLLSQNYPNPFSGSTEIQYQLPEPSHVKLTVYDNFGKQVAVLVNSDQDSGEYTETWKAKDNSGSNLAAGIYLVRLEASSLARKHVVFNSKRMLLIN